ncbi:MAG: RagB/SusD family nutrient uptake outer membrane protein [Flavobacteriales bacterium]|nr:RagB/SusD family nutrient uptake outer membrane protein [Flavobacteriales bacterium]
MKKIILSLIAAVVVASCSTNLDQSPTDVFPTDDLAKVDADKIAKPILSNGVLRMHNMGSGTAGIGFKNMMLAMDLLGNDMLMPLAGHGGWFLSDYMMNNYRGKTDARAVALWGNLYRNIYTANQTIEFLPEDLSTAKDPAVAKFVKAQAMTYRAFNYYFLLCVYQDAYLQGGKEKAGIPYYTSTSAPAAGRGEAETVYQTVMTDITEAIALFKESGLTVTSKEELSIYAAYMVQARLALTMGQYATAITAADEVIKAFSLMSKDQAMDNGFQDIDGPETIWGYKWVQNTTNQNNSFSSHISTNVAGAYGGEGSGWKIIDERLYNQIQATDWRKDLFYATATPITYVSSTTQTITVTALSNKKFNAAEYNNDEIYLRAAEAYYIKAEAQARSTGDAAQTLYNVVSTRDAAYTKSSKTGTALVDEILLQKRIELWGEGNEFFDNKRIGKGVDRASSKNHTVTNIVAAGKDFTFQLPKTTEIERNPNISDKDNNPD